MKIILSLLLLAFISCRKETPAPFSITGKWRFKEALMSPGGINVITTPADPALPSYIEFKEDGTFTADTVDVYSLYRNISDCNSYYINDTQICFYKKGSTDSVRTSFEYVDGLLLQFNFCREYCADRFVRAR